MADANEKRDWRIFADFAQLLIAEARRLYADEDLGLVDGLEKELGYVSLKELESVRGPMGLPIKRDLYWTPKPLREIAQEMFDQAIKKAATEVNT